MLKKGLAMDYNKRNQGEAFNSVRFKRSVLAMCVMALSAPSFAQTATNTNAPKKDDTVEEVVVTGMKEALGSAQENKRNADTVIESITAKDLGAFPDKSVAEALQRVAGITVNRFAASGDTAHFSAEPSGVIVRGLNQVRTEFNGRDSFSANSSRGLSWGDVSPELMSGVDTYKNQTAELIEGGLAGTVNMRTRVPFDQPGEMKALSLDANYGDISKKLTPEISALYSNRWEVSSGEMGFLINVAHSEVQTATQGIQYGRIGRFENIYAPNSLLYMPTSVVFRDNVYNRDRDGVAFAAQWKDNDGVLEGTVQYNRSKYKNAWEEYVVTASVGADDYGKSSKYVHKLDDKGAVPTDVPQALPGTPAFTFNDKGLFQSGAMTSDIGWWGANDAGSAQYGAISSGKPVVHPCYNWDSSCATPRRGRGMSTSTRSNNNENLTQDIGFNLKWNPTDTVHGTFDVQYVDSTVSNYDISTDFNSFANTYADISKRLPTVEFSAPLNGNQSAGGLANPNNYYINDIMDHFESSKGHEFAARTDFKFDIDSNWISSVKVGARYADREQNVNWSNYNWQNVANTWTSCAQNETIPNPKYDPNDSKSPKTVDVCRENQSSYYNLDSHSPAPLLATGATKPGDFKGYPQGYYVNRAFNPGYGSVSPNEYVFANMKLLQDRKAFASAMSATALGLTGGTGWDPICSNTGDRAGEVAGTCFTPAESAVVSEVTSAIYAQLNFGGSDATLGGIPFSGNIGARFIETTVESSGGLVMPKALDKTQLECKPKDAPLPGQPAPAVPNTVGCYLSAEDISFMNGANFTGTSTSKSHALLPSFNVKFDLTDEVLLRVALARAMARPDIGNLKNYVGVSSTLPNGDNASDPLWVKDSSGKITGANVKYNGSAQNPFLKPITADQLDVSFEWYFAKVGSLTFTAFEKRFNDYIQFGTYNRQFTNNGVTRTAEIRGPFNGDGASLSGFEVAYQTFFDFLPEPFDGLGVQANYTHIKNKGIANTNLSNVGVDTSGTITGQAPDSIQVNRLEGLSDHSANLIGMYEKGDWAVRVAYSWRSAYMVTAIDCCVSYPIWNTATGQLDGSIRYKINDNIEVMLSGSNLLNEQTVLEQQVSDQSSGGLRLPNASTQQDRRLTFGVRMKY